MQEPETKNFAFFRHKDCEYFPCHEVDDPEKFNCLFCYCPLYALGEECGGNYVYTKKGIKDCSNCILPHQPDSFDYVKENFSKIIELVKKEEINE